MALPHGACCPFTISTEMLEGCAVAPEAAYACFSDTALVTGSAA